MAGIRQEKLAGALVQLVGICLEKLMGPVRLAGICLEKLMGALVQLDDIYLEELMGPVRLVGILKNRGSWLVGLTGCLYFGDYMVISLFSLSFGIWTEICG